MEDIKKALAFAIGARAVAAALGLVAVPLYLHFLGTEAYGVIGLFASLQGLLAFMDMGLSTTLTRELAGATQDPARMNRGRDFTRTFELAYVALAALTAALLALGAPWVAVHWVNLQALQAAEVTHALQMAGLALACAWPANLYGAGLAGLHRQTPLALATTGFAGLRLALGLACLYWSPTLASFFAAQVAASVLQSLGMRALMMHAMGRAAHRPVARWQHLQESGRFAGGMTAITITSILLVQVDKVILSHLLPLAEFGLYVIAASLAAGLYVLISPVFSVIYPRLAALWTAGDMPGSAALYHASSQAMAALVLPLGAVMACFPQAALLVLTNDLPLSHQGAWVLTFLVLGSALNGVMNAPYALQLAAGWTSLSVWFNSVAVAALIPAAWWATTHWGAVGGAAVWCLLNVACLLITPHWLHGRLLPDEKWRWYRRDVAAPAATALGVALLLRLWLGGTATARWPAMAELALCWLAALGATVATLPHLRPWIRRIVWRN